MLETLLAHLSVCLAGLDNGVFQRIDKFVTPHPFVIVDEMELVYNVVNLLTEAADARVKAAALQSPPTAHRQRSNYVSKTLTLTDDSPVCQIRTHER